jgi:hypothetical protein
MTVDDAKASNDALKRRQSGGGQGGEGQQSGEGVIPLPVSFPSLSRATSPLNSQVTKVEPDSALMYVCAHHLAVK